MYIFLLLITNLAFSQTSDLQNLIEKTYSHDNLYCNLNGKRIEFELRGSTRFTEPKDKFYGEYLLYRVDGVKRQIIINKDQIHSYRFFPGKDTLCGKSLGFTLTDTMSAILFMEENFPHPGKLAVLLYDHKKQEARGALETQFLTDTILPFKNGFIFNSLEERSSLEMGTIPINGADYTYQDRSFQPWISFSIKGFRIEPSATFEQFPWKSHFKNKKEFLKMMKWNKTSKTFGKAFLYLAVNHSLKKECFLVSSEKIKINGTEAWHCL